MRPSDEILEGLNRLNKAKETGVYGDNELCELLIKIVDLSANGLENGKVSPEAADDIKVFIPKTNIFKLSHNNLQVAYNTANEALSIASANVDEKSVTVGMQKELRKVA